LTTVIEANNDDDPAYSVKTQAPGRNVLGAKRSGGELAKGRNVHKPAGIAGIGIGSNTSLAKIQYSICVEKAPMCRCAPMRVLYGPVNNFSLLALVFLLSAN